MTRLYLVRHAATIWNNESRLQGQRDIPLSDQGRDQAKALARRMRDFQIDAAYSSDLERAVSTAAILLEGRAIGALPITALREASFGRWEGLTYGEVTKRYPEEQAARRARPAELAPAGGESMPDVLRRVGAAIDRIIADHPDRSVLVVTHGGPVRLIVMRLLDLGLENYWKIRVDNCSLSIIDTYPEGAILSLFNDTCRLSVLGNGAAPGA